MMLENPNVRKVLYVVVMAAGVAAVTFGVVDQSQADQWVAIVMGVFGVVGGGTAIGHLNPPPTKRVVLPQVEQHVRSQVEEARRRIEHRLGG